MDRSIGQDHPCFEAVAMFCVTWAGIISAANIALIAREYIKYKSDHSPEQFKIPEFHTKTATLKSINSTSTTTISNLGCWVNYISGNKSERPDEVRFKYLPGKDYDQPAISEQSLGNMRDSRFVIEQSTCQAIGVAYEKNQARIKTIWGRNYRLWPAELQFFRHSRNACYHGNTFNIRDWRSQPAIDLKAPPKWSGLIIPDKSVNGLRFVGEFFDYSLVLPFLADVGDRLR